MFGAFFMVKIALCHRNAFTSSGHYLGLRQYFPVKNGQNSYIYIVYKIYIIQYIPWFILIF